MYEIEELKKALGSEPSYRYKQAYKAILVDHIAKWAEVTTLPNSVRENLSQKFPLLSSDSVFTSVSTDKKTEKALLTLSDGARIEAVLMKYGDNHNTICVSTQVGCAMGCAFCATGKLGFSRNLTAWEIVEQVLHFSRTLGKKNERVSNVVFMGMGEPFENYDAVIEAIKILNDPDGFKLGARKMSVSTCGLVPEIKKFADEGFEVNLAVSLHSANQEKRQGFMPISHRYKLDEVMEAVDYYIEKTNRKIMIEYILLKGVNDTKQDAVDLQKLLKGKLCMVNLIPYNDTGEFEPTDNTTVRKFKEVLSKGGIEVTQRYRFGSDIKAACGQLAASK